jgi:type VI secretion system VasD/TssJ family lipoprotein
MPRALVLLACAALLPLAACAKVPVVGGKPQLTVRLTAIANSNSCGKAAGYPLTYRVIQATDASALTGISLVQLWDREDKALGAAFLSKSEDVIDPGTKKEFKVERNPKAKFAVVVGNFCKAQGACWSVIQPLSKGSTIRLSVDANCFQEAKH